MTDPLLTESVFRRLIDEAPDAMVIVDESARIVFVNGQTELVFGHARDALVGQPIEVLIPERFRAAHVGHRSRFLESPKLRPMGSSMELFGLCKDGSELPVEISLSPLETEHGRMVSAAIRDVSERRRMVAAARRATQLLINAIESFQGAFALFDDEDLLIRCNSTFRMMFGSGIDDVTGHTHGELLDASIAAGVFDPGDAPAEELRARWQAYHRQPSGSFEVRMADGRIIRVTDRRTSDGGTVSSTADITADVEREEAVRAARAAAEAASSAKSEFLSSMSHELRTPLNAVLGFAQLLRRDKKTPLSERQQERLEHVLKGGEHLLRLIDDVLDLSRIEAGRVTISLEPVSVAEVLVEVQNTLEPMAARAGIELLIAPHPGPLPQVFGDRTRFAQILMNYGSNAVKYGRAGGRVTLSASLREGRLRVEVADDGIGIPLEKQDGIFQPFQRAGQETGPIEGTGIGLAISKRLAEIMGGRVGFSSTPGEGSRFWIELPIHRQAEAASPREQLASRPEPSPLAGPDGSRHVVIYVEDNPSNIAFMEDFLADYERITLMVAPTAEIGLELARAHRPDVIIMDVNLPKMSGFEATRRLREWPETQDIPVVALSAAAMVSDRKRVEAAGFFRYLTKPVQVDALAEVLEQLLV